MMSDENSTTMPVLAVNAEKAAAMVGSCRASWYMLVNQGLAPQGFRLGKRHLWSVAELSEWVRAGCPPAVKWRAMQDAKR